VFRIATFRASISGGSLFRAGAGTLVFLLPLLLQIVGAALIMRWNMLQTDDLLQIEWVKWGGFSQVECDSKGFFVNVTVTSSRHVCAHAKIEQDEAPER
jgi:hypothetical protein